MDKIAVLIPCFNDAQTIEKVVTDFHRVLPEAVIYVYDNNSTDGTADIAERIELKTSTFQQAWAFSCACFLNGESNVCFSVAQRCFLWYNNLTEQSQIEDLDCSGEHCYAIRGFRPMRLRRTCAYSTGELCYNNLRNIIPFPLTRME